MPPPNTTIGTAIPISIPSTTVVDVSGISPAYTVWYSYTAQPDDVIIGLLAYAVSGSNYKPNLTVWIGPIGAPVMWPYDMTLTNTPQGNAFFDSDQPCQIPVIPGVTYYIKVEPNVGSTTVAPNLTLGATAQPNISPVIGDILITDDQSKFPGAILSQIDGTIKKFYNLTNGEAGDTIRSTGIIALSNDDDVNEVGDPSKIFIYDKNLAQVTSVAISTPQSISIRASATNFFFSLWNNPTGTVQRLYPSGLISGTWSVAGAQIIAPSRDESILYYSNGNAGSAIKRWDLINNVGLSDLIAAPGAGYSLLNTDGTIIVLSDNSIIVMWAVGGTNNFSIRQYDPTGTLLRTYAFNLPALNQAGGRVATAPDDPISFWAWSSYFSGSYVISQYTRFKTSDGSTISTFSPPVFEGGAGTAGTGNQGIPPIIPFGNSWSCPLIILSFAPSPPPPVPGNNGGIYYIKLGKTNDTLYYSNYFTQVTNYYYYNAYSIVTMIPNPFFII